MAFAVRFPLAARTRLRQGHLHDLTAFEARVYSQNGEDGVLQALFRVLGTTNRFFVEIGTGNGRECNSRLLGEHGWRGVMLDAQEGAPPPIVRAFVTAENVNDLLRRQGVPREFDLLSIDIDSNDYWIWEAVSDFSPRVVVTEYNASFPPPDRRAVVYEPTATWDGSNYFGASLQAFVDLAERKGYRLVGCESTGVNAFFVRSDLVDERMPGRTVEELYRPPAYGPEGRGHPPSDRPWAEL